jgi:GNAT superfamily N-acetyltransferase
MNTTAPHASVQLLGSGAGAVSAAHIDHTFRAILRGEGVDIDRRFARLITGAPHPFGNFAIINDRFDVGATEIAVQPLLDVTEPAAALYYGPVNPPVLERRTALGFEHAESMPAMVVDIDTLAATSLPAGYTFDRFGQGADSDAWVEAFSLGFEIPRVVSAYFSPNTVSASTEADAPIQYFAIRRGGAMVCMSMLHLAHGVAGIYCVATIPEERRKGLAAHVTAEPLRLARQIGYRVGVLQSTHAGHNVYRQLGFTDVGDVPMYVRLPG